MNQTNNRKANNVIEIEDDLNDFGDDFAVDYLIDDRKEGNRKEHSRLSGGAADSSVWFHSNRQSECFNATDDGESLSPFQSNVDEAPNNKAHSAPIFRTARHLLRPVATTTLPKASGCKYSISDKK